MLDSDVPTALSQARRFADPTEKSEPALAHGSQPRSGRTKKQARNTMLAESHPRPKAKPLPADTEDEDTADIYTADTEVTEEIAGELQGFADKPKMGKKRNYANRLSGVSMEVNAPTSPIPAVFVESTQAEGGGHATKPKDAPACIPLWPTYSVRSDAVMCCLEKAGGAEINNSWLILRQHEPWVNNCQWQSSIMTRALECTCF